MFIKILWVSLVGGIINLDEHTWVQSMICRPVITGPVIGYLLGDLNTGLIFGILIELILFNVLPMGAAMPINFSIITILATALAIMTAEADHISIGPSFIVWILAWTLPLGLIYREIENINRRINIRLVHFAEKRISKGRINAVEEIMCLGVLISFLKAVVFIMLVLLLWLYILPKCYIIIPEKVLNGLETAYVLIFILGISSTIKTFKTRLGKKIEKNNAD